MLKLIDSKDPLLRTKQVDMPPDRWKLKKDLIDTLTEGFPGALGLASNQVGLTYNAFVMYKDDEYVAIFSPVIEEYSENQDVKEEGCLSFPDIFVKVPRSTNIQVTYEDEKGRVYNTSLTGNNARIFQHEYDHLQGLTFLDRVSKYHRQKALNKRKNVI